MSTSPPSRADRVRHRLAGQYSLFLAVLLLLAVGSGFVAFQAHAHPDAITEERTVASWTSDTGFDHRATVRRDALAFDAGETLRDRSLYFSSVAPVLSGNYTYRYTGDANGVDVRTDLRLVVRSVDERGERPETLWRITEPLVTEQTTGLRPGAVHRASFALNVTRLANLTSRVRDELGASPGQTQILVVATTEANATLDGDPSTVGRTERMTIRPGRATYAVATNESEGAPKEVTEQVTVPAAGDPLREWGALALALAGFGGAAALVRAERNGRLDVSPAVAAEIRRRGRHDEFAEWISAGRVPQAAADDRVVAVATLADLVDVAIDSNERVIYDDAADTYVVIDGDVRYLFDADGRVDDVSRPADPGSDV